MNATMQALVTFAIVAIATGYAVVKLMPKAWRVRVAAGAAVVASRVGLSDSAARRVEAKLASGGACGSCDSCRACATPAEGEAAIVSSTTPHRHIPIRRV